MTPAILLVDDQRDVLRLLHSVLDTLQLPDVEIIEAVTGEEALLETSRRPIDLLVIDYRLPGMTGIEMMHKVRVGQPDVKVIIITGTTSRKARAEMLNAGAVAVFDKPVPLADFLDAVERSLGLVRAVFPGEGDQEAAGGALRLPDVLSNFRQSVQASAVFLINDRGLVVARAGDLRDSSTEVSLISALTAAASAGIKVAKSNRQDAFDQFSVFSGGDHDLVLMPVDPNYSLLLAGDNLEGGGTLFDTIRAMQAVRAQVAQSLRAIGAPADGDPAAPPAASEPAAEAAADTPAPEMERLLKEAGQQPLQGNELDAYWEQAAAQHANRPSSSDVIPYDEARKLGLTPDEK